MAKCLVLIAILFPFLKSNCQVDSMPPDFDNPSYTSQLKNNNALKITGYSAVYACGTFFCYKYLDTGIKNFAQSNQSKTVTSISIAYQRLGTGASNIIITAATGITSVIIKNKKLEKTSILLISGHLINDLITNQAKITFQRYRPNTGDPYNTFDWRGGPKKNTSFFSAHTSNAFVTATAFATCFKDTKWVPVVAYSAAGLVGLCRIYNNAHWTSDVLAGAACGFASVKAMNGIYKLASKRFSFIPEVYNGHYNITVLYCLE
jgi:membrane-associated phospholipid phosphatase